MVSDVLALVLVFNILGLLGPAPGCSPPPGVPANVVVSSTFETPVQPSYNAGAGQENSSTKAGKF